MRAWLAYPVPLDAARRWAAGELSDFQLFNLAFDAAPATGAAGLFIASLFGHGACFPLARAMRAWGGLDLAGVAFRTGNPALAAYATRHGCQALYTELDGKRRYLGQGEAARAWLARWARRGGGAISQR